MWAQVKGVTELQKREAELFGSSDQSVGRSKVRMMLSAEKLEDPRRKGYQFQGGRLLGAHYLAYGVMEAFASRNKGTQAGELTRPMIPGGTFSLNIRFSRGLTDTQCQEVQDALILLGTVGGIGSKARKGFGSLTLTELVRDGEIVQLGDTPRNRLRKVLSGLTVDLPQWTAWSSKSRVVTGHAGGEAEQLLDLGQELVFYRSWGRQGKVLGQTSEKNFREDHDLYKTPHSSSISYPRRVVFGLPHNYGKHDTVEPERPLDRRASPLFLHIHQVSPTSQPQAVISFLPSVFLPKGVGLVAFGKAAQLESDEELWKPIHGYLDRLLSKPGATKKKTNLKCEEIDLV